MRQYFPTFVFDRPRRSWTGTLRPFDDLGKYRIRVTLDPGQVPVTRILSPTLAPGTRHLHGDGSLCLYLPDDPEAAHWNDGDLISHTVIPWAASWINCYETCLVTGTWPGPEAPHGTAAIVI